MDEFKVKVGIQLETDELNNLKGQINGVKTNPIKVTLDMPTIQSQINSIKTQLQSLNNIKINLGSISTSGVGSNRSGGSNIARTSKEVTRAYNELMSLQKRINSIELKLPTLNASESFAQVKNLLSLLENLRNRFSELYNLRGGELSGLQMDNLNRSIEITDEKISTLTAKLADLRTEFAKEIDVKIKVGDFDVDSSKIHKSFDKIINKSEECEKAVKEFDQALENLKLANEVGDIERLTRANEEYEQALKKVNNQLKINATADADIVNAQKLENAKRNFSNSVKNYMTENTAAARHFRQEFERIIDAIQKCDNTADLDNLKSDLKELQSTCKSLNLETKGLGGGFKNQLSKLSIYFSAFTILNWVDRAFRSMYNNVVEIDSAMTELIKVTDETDAAYDKFLSNIGTRAQEIGSTMSGLISSTADFARLGFSLDEAQELAEVANIYAVVGDDINSVEMATQSIISTMTAFGIEASNAISIVDKFNEVGNNFAISSGGIGDALTRSASSMAAANNTIDETIALITAANTVVQDVDSVGNAFKTISMRIRGAKTELEEAGLETEGMASSTAKLREEILALSGVDIMLDDSTFKSTYQILEELSSKWKELTDIQQASITELIAGKIFCQNVQKCA